MSCDRFAQVHAYHDGEIAGANERSSLEAHLASCDPCAELLAELQSLSRLLAEVPLPDEADRAPMSRYYGAFHKAQGQMQRGILRLSGWMTTAAAVVIAVTLLRTPPVPQETIVSPGRVSTSIPTWQYVAVMPPSEQEGDRAGDDRVVVAQWTVDDLTSGGERE
jgi:anti-sigma factor RsiW